MTKLPGSIAEREGGSEGRDAATEPREKNSVVSECELPQAPEQVWKALTVPKLLAAWLPDAVNSEILAAEPNRLLRYRWPAKEDDRDPKGQTLESVVTFELTATPAGGTHLRVVHRVTGASNIVALKPRRRTAVTSCLAVGEPRDFLCCAPVALTGTRVFGLRRAA